MTTADVVFFSSSPPRFFQNDVFAESILSSPNFPSPRELIRKKPQLRSGSRAAPIPENANSSFTSAATLLQQTDNLDDFKEWKSVTAVAPQAIGEDQDGIPQTKSRKTTRKPRTKPIPQTTTESDSKDKPVRKPRIKKTITEVQTKLPKGKITKTSTTTSKRTARKKATETVSSHFDTTAIESPKPVEHVPGRAASPILEAVKRRSTWTPPRDTAVSNDAVVVTPIEDAASQSMELFEAANEQGVFANLVGSFGYDPEDSARNTTKAAESAEPTKRKLIERADTSPVVIVAKKTKPARKKPRTITELSTSAFSSEKSREESSVATAPLLQYFSPDNKHSVTIDGFKVPPKPRSRPSPAKSASRSSKSKKIRSAEILLSPESALQQAGRQDFVFGTSSQLARENSPTLLRDLHQAMLLSNQSDDPFSESPARASEPAESGIAAQRKKMSLWEAASMGDVVDLVDVEVVDLVNSPYIMKPNPLQGITFHSSQVLQVKEQSLSKNIPGIRNETNDDVAASASASESSMELKLRTAPSSKLPDLQVVQNSTVGDSAPAPISPPKNAGDPKDPQELIISPKKTAKRKMPDYSSYTKERLEKAIRTYHFKHIKGRERMIKLLEQCWESKQKLKEGTLEPHPVLSVSPVKSQAGSTQTTPKKPRGRPASAGSTGSQTSVSTPKGSRSKAPQTKKQTTKNNSIPEEISDSDTPLTPSPPRRRASKVGSPPAPLELSASADTTAEANASKTTNPDRDLLYKHITRAITSAPRSSDPQNPSWHEKILLYDPIVLEDLAAWLNLGALEEAGWEGEVDLKDVKRWCWDRGICCTGRETLRGGSRTRL